MLVQDRGYWLWPVPLSFACEWAAFTIPETELGNYVLDSARRTSAAMPRMGVQLKSCHG